MGQGTLNRDIHPSLADLHCDRDGIDLTRAKPGRDFESSEPVPSVTLTDSSLTASGCQ